MTAVPKPGAAASGTPPRRVRGLGWRRLRGLIRKESLQIVRDPSSISIAFVLPLVLLFLFGYGVSLDAKNIPVALVVEEPTPDAARFAVSFVNSSYFAPVFLRDRRVAERALLKHEVEAIVVLRSDFAENLWRSTGAPIQLVINGTDANRARIVAGYVRGLWQGWLQQVALEEGRQLATPVEVEQRVWFNAEVRST
ncbi:MAG: ABC transporter permease, partial [Alphaproteobacteria bacterium]